MILASSLDTRGTCQASCTAVHGAIDAASQQFVAGSFKTYAVIAPYLVQTLPDEISVTIDDRDVTLLMGSGGPNYG